MKVFMDSPAFNNIDQLFSKKIELLISPLSLMKLTEFYVADKLYSSAGIEIKKANRRKGGQMGKLI